MYKMSYVISWGWQNFPGLQVWETESWGGQRTCQGPTFYKSRVGIWTQASWNSEILLKMPLIVIFPRFLTLLWNFYQFKQQPPSSKQVILKDFIIWGGSPRWRRKSGWTLFCPYSVSGGWWEWGIFGFFFFHFLCLNLFIYSADIY